jgi:BASS family bile acid:Na+ symporter
MTPGQSPLRHFQLVFAVCLVVIVLAGATGNHAVLGPAVIVAFASLALRFMGHPLLRYYSFTVWVFAFVSASMIYPRLFLTWTVAGHPFDLKLLITPLLQIITFGMGTTLALADFTRIFKMPWPIFIGFVAQFLIMPLTGFLLANAFGFEAGIAAGIVLIGSCPSGVASNVMTYLAGGDVALSVTITSCTTLAAPLLTPLLMKQLAGQFIEVNLFGMMIDIVNVIIVPIVAGLIAHRILYGKDWRLSKGGVLATIGGACVLASLAMVCLVPDVMATFHGASLRREGLVVGLLLVGLVTLAKLVIRVWLAGPENWMDRVLPTVSMVAICCIIAVITARSAKDLREVGLLLIGVTVIHNAVGYLLGYWMARAARLQESWCRTVAFEVGMQNGGLASSLAMNTLNNTQAALAPAIFGPWQNVSGSILATWWRRKPTTQTAERTTQNH